MISIMLGNTGNIMKVQCALFIGEFSADMKHGLGKLMLTNDEYFIGNFDQDIVDGYGKFYGRMVIADGIWKNNRLIKIE
jgi:hypothetical protein